MQQSNIQVKAEILCNQCIVTLMTKLNLEEVTKENRSNGEKKKENTKCEKKFQCEVCEFTTHWGSSLKRHIEEVHKLIKYPCDLCDKTFTRKRDVKRHKQSIHELTKYPCDLCKYQANRKDTLKRHIRGVHQRLF